MVPGGEAYGVKAGNSVAVSGTDRRVLVLAVRALLGTGVTAEGAVRWSLSKRDGARSSRRSSFVESHKREKHARLFHVGIVQLDR
jgi:hypothetical protein